jgi:two-component system sensor histidine kinase CiaH
MVSYSPLDEERVLRVTLSMEDLSKFRRNFTLIILFTLPGMLLVSFVLSRYMVKQSLKPVKEALTYQETFSSNIAHELNSPLTSIKGNVEVTLRSDRSREEYRKTLREVLMKANEIINLLNNLLLLARADFRPLHLMRERVNIGEVIERLQGKYEHVLLSRGIKFQPHIHSRANCFCDASLMRRALENLLDNAVKYTPDHGSISITAFRKKDIFILTVSNTCEGLTKDEINNIFRPFYRGSRSYPGRGLGLYIVQYIIRSHGGTISADVEDRELTLTVSIPDMVINS